MQFTLLTYDCYLMHNAGYADSSDAVAFAKILTDLAAEFKKHSGVDTPIYWKSVNDSDWCKNMLILYAKVDADYVPTENTTIVDRSYDTGWYPYLSTSISNWIVGRGNFTDIRTSPAQTPHNLYRTKIK
jgi:hypothetical protein